MNWQCGEGMVQMVVAWKVVVEAAGNKWCGSLCDESHSLDAGRRAAVVFFFTLLPTRRAGVCGFDLLSCFIEQTWGRS
jgi:hypothetical protein